MSAQSRLFTRVQNADFYRRYLLDALRLLPAGQGRTFLDVGCGPGVRTRLAAAHGYLATGLDIDASMITAGRRIARREGSAALFRQ